MAQRQSNIRIGNRKSPNGGERPLMVAILLLTVLVVVACVVYKQPPHETASTVAEVADLITNDRMIYGGLPKSRNDAAAYETLTNDAYIVGYSESRKDPLFCAYRVFHTLHPFNLPRPTGGFLTDPRTSAHVRDSDFARSGYDRGHMAPNSAIMHCYGGTAQLQTFLLSNICPQSPLLNERVWERLEADERKYAEELEEVWVIDGPIFGDLNGGSTNRLASGVSVPTAFYKILVDEQDHLGGKARIFAVIMPQNVKGTELPQQFLTSVREIEKETQLDFFWKLDTATQADLESKVWSMWNNP